MCVCIYIYIYIYTYIHNIYIYIYRERERHLRPAADEDEEVGEHPAPRLGVEAEVEEEARQRRHRHLLPEVKQPADARDGDHGQRHLGRRLFVEVSQALEEVPVGHVEGAQARGRLAPVQAAVGQGDELAVALAAHLEAEVLVEAELREHVVADHGALAPAQARRGHGPRAAARRAQAALQQQLLHHLEVRVLDGQRLLLQRQRRCPRHDLRRRLSL